MKKLIILLTVSLAGVAGLIGWALHSQYTSTQNIPIFEAPNGLSNTEKIQPSSSPTPVILPSTISLNVPYTLQAPFNKWDHIHEDACEVTSLIMINHFLDGKAIGSPTSADAEIIAAMQWRFANGYPEDNISLAQLNQISKDHYSRTNGQVVPITSVEDIKRELAAGHPVITGMNGKTLPNPYFSDGGPVYHMLVIKGYDATGFITNDPGTWHGEGFHYDYDIFYDSIRDWNTGNIQTGQKAYLVFR